MVPVYVAGLMRKKVPLHWWCSWVLERCGGIFFFGSRIAFELSGPMKTRATLYINMDLPNAGFRLNVPAKRREAGLRIFSPTRQAWEYTTSVVGFSLLSFVRTSYNGFFFRHF